MPPGPGMGGFGGPRMRMGQRKPLEKEKLDLKSLLKMIKYMLPYLPPIILGILFSLAGTVTTIIGPKKIAELTNIIKGGIDTSVDMVKFRNIALFLIGIYCIGALFNYIQQLIMALVNKKISKSLRTDINRKLNRLPLAFFDQTTKGDILSRVTNDVDTLSQTLASSFANLLSSAVLFVGVLFMMFSMNLILTLTTILSSVVGFIFTAIIMSKSQKLFNKRQMYLGEINGHIEEIYTNHTTVKSYNAVRLESDKFDDINNNLYKTTWKSHFIGGMVGPIMGFTSEIAYVLIFIVGINLILLGYAGVDLGILMGFTIYAKLFSQPLRSFGNSVTSIQQASASSRRIFEILESEEMENESNKNTKIENVNGEVEFRNVKFGYTKDRIIIKDFSAKLKAGQKVAIVGPTGAGKTTMVNLLMRFYETNSGDIFIDGVSIKDMKREEVHNLFDMILQDTWLFCGTIRENLVYNNKGVTDEELDKVCKAVGLKHFIETLSDGYNTVLGDLNSLSEGQKQQLTIARAMLKNSPLLILDEATSNVDTRTEIIIQNAMDKLTKDRTSFVIAHRLSTIKNADIILVMKDGDIIETGNHKELLAKKGFYAELYNSQFSEVG